ncbi:FHA domain-containing protein [Enhygromyxa salina]|nr:FHA domain-containing protein [Enhygromyxa salina]
MAQTIPCPACGTDNSTDEVRCHVCDYELRARLPGPADMSKCPRCGSGVAGGAAFCQVCGQSVELRHARPHTGALNVRAMFGDQVDIPSRMPIREHTEIAPSARQPGSPTFAPPGRGGSPPSEPHRDSTPDPSAPRGKRRPAPRPRPNYAGFDAAESGKGDRQRGGTAPPGGYEAQGPVYSNAPPRAQAAPRPQARDAADPGASSSNLPRPRVHAEVNAEPIAPVEVRAQVQGQARAQARDQARGQRLAAPVIGGQPAQTWASPQPSSSQRLVLVGRDGREGEAFALPPIGVEIGREGGIAFPSDPFVSPQHAKVTPVDGGVHLADLGSRNGVFLRLTEAAPVYPGDHFLLGNQMLRLDQPDVLPQEVLDAQHVRGFGTPVKPPWAALTQVCIGEIEGDRYHLRGTEITIGREQGEIVFPSDGFLSRAHARVRMELFDNAMTVLLEDLGSANGTYLRIRGAVSVPYGSMFRVGDQIFRVRRD